jgi:hypothetical protein
MMAKKKNFKCTVKKYNFKRIKWQKFRPFYSTPAKQSKTKLRSPSVYCLPYDGKYNLSFAYISLVSHYSLIAHAQLSIQAHPQIASLPQRLPAIEGGDRMTDDQASTPST